MVATAKPPHIQRIIILIVMGVDILIAANFAAFPFENPRLKRPLNRQMSVILGRIGAPPVRLSRLAFNHLRSQTMWADQAYRRGYG